MLFYKSTHVNKVDIALELRKLAFTCEGRVKAVLPTRGSSISLYTVLVTADVSRTNQEVVPSHSLLYPIYYCTLNLLGF